MGFIPKEHGEPVRDLNELEGKNVVVYDLEIKNEISKIPGGWGNHAGMGISVGCAFDYRLMRYRVFMDDNIQELVDRLNEEGTLVTAFNNMTFDNKLLRVNGLNLKPDDQLINYDMMRVSKIGAGINPQRPIKGFKLDQHLEALQLPLKTADGAMAPIWWQQGKVGTVVDYCLADVHQERALFDYMYKYGRVASGYNPKPYAVDMPTINT